MTSHFIGSLKDISILSAATWRTIGALLAFTLIHAFVTVPQTDRALVALYNRKRADKGIDPVSYEAWIGERQHRRLAILGAAFLGAVLGSVRVCSTSTFDWYIRTGITAAPDYGAVTPWLVNALLVAALACAVGLAVSPSKAGRLGYLAAPVELVAALTAFLLGFVAGPLGLVGWLAFARFDAVATVRGLMLLPLRALEPFLDVGGGWRGR